jgi:hypothetical protein
MADFNIMDHLSRQGGGFSGGGGQAQAPAGDGIANEKETPEILLEAAKKTPGTVAKLVEAIPILGPLLSAIIPTNAGEVSALSSFETQGIAGKMINPTKGGPQGGALYNAIFAPLIKNSTISDQTGGTGGGGGGEAGASAGGGSNFSDFSQMSLGDIGGGASYEWTNVPMASLGDLPRPILPDSGRGGPEMGVA